MSVTAVISAIIAAIKAVPIVDGWFRALVVAWMQSQEKATYQKIIDAAAFSARAATDADRYAAAAKWQEALSQPRQLP